MIWQYFIPKRLITSLAGKLASCQQSYIKNTFIKLFARRYKVDLSEAIYANPEDYKSFNDFFTRALKPGSRPFDLSAEKIICPADGYLSELGSLHNNALLQAKKQKYTLHDLLAQQNDRIEMFRNGLYLTVYLAPRNYHRVHLPIDGRLSQIVYVPGALFSVNFNSANTIPNLFARNERLILYFETNLGTMAVILVGAMIVGDIVTPWTGSVAALRKQGKVQQWTYHNETILCKKGDEIGQFQLGSTVIILFTRGALEWSNNLEVTQTVQMGQTLATCKFSNAIADTKEANLYE